MSKRIDVTLTATEPRVRIVLAPGRGIERIEVWGRDDADQQQARQLFFELADQLRQLDTTARSVVAD
jgi:hypothetical protein